LKDDYNIPGLNPNRNGGIFFRVSSAGIRFSLIASVWIRQLIFARLRRVAAELFTLFILKPLEFFDQIEFEFD
jgi:hypothetical protein